MNSSMNSVNLGRKKKMLAGLGCLLYAVFVMAWSGVAHAEAYLSDFAVASSVDEYTFAPLETQQSFNQNVSEIWATAFVNQAVDGTLVEADWLFLRNGQYQKILGSRMQVEGDRYFAAQIQPMEGEQLPVGKYRVIFKLNGEEQGSVNLQVTQANAVPEPRKMVEMNATVDQPAATVCTPPDESEAEIAEWVGGEENRVYFGFGRYSDPQGRFSMIVPGGWFVAETGDPNEALFLSQNMENDPVAWFVLHVYAAHLTPKFSASDTVNQLREMFVQEGKSHGAEPIDEIGGETEAIARTVATGGLALYYETSSAQKIMQLHQFVVDGEYGFNIQISLEMEKDIGDVSAENTAEMAAYLIAIARASLWTKQLCEHSASQ